MSKPQQQSNQKKGNPMPQVHTEAKKPAAPPPPAEVKPTGVLAAKTIDFTTMAKDDPRYIAHLAEEKVKADAAAASAAQQKPPAPEKPKVEKVELKCGNPLGSMESQWVRKGSAVGLIYGFLTVPKEQAMTVEQMAKVLHDGAFATHSLESVTTNVRVEIAASKSKRGMRIGRDALGRYNVNIEEQNRGRVLTPEQQKEKEAKAAAREVKKAERFAALNAKRAEKKQAKEAAAAAAKLAGDAQKAADAAKTPEQIQAELKAAGVNAKIVT